MRKKYCSVRFVCSILIASRKYGRQPWAQSNGFSARCRDRLPLLHTSSTCVIRHPHRRSAIQNRMSIGEEGTRGVSSVEVYGFVGWISSFVAYGGSWGDCPPAFLLPPRMNATYPPHTLSIICSAIPGVGLHTPASPCTHRCDVLSHHLLGPSHPCLVLRHSALPHPRL